MFSWPNPILLLKFDCIERCPYCPTAQWGPRLLLQSRRSRIKNSQSVVCSGALYKKHKHTGPRDAPKNHIFTRPLYCKYQKPIGVLTHWKFKQKFHGRGIIRILRYVLKSKEELDNQTLGMADNRAWGKWRMHKFLSLHLSSLFHLSLHLCFVLPFHWRKGFSISQANGHKDSNLFIQK